MLAQAKSADFVTSRVFDAPRELVWQASPNRAHEGVVGSQGLHHRRLENGFARRRNLSRRHARSRPASVMWAKFVYREIAAPERLVWVHSFSDEAGGLTRHPLSPNWPLELLTTVTFEDAPGNKTKVTLRWSPINATAEEQRLSKRRRRHDPAVGPARSSGSTPISPKRSSVRGEASPRQRQPRCSPNVKLPSRACSMRRARWCSKPGPTRNCWRSGGARKASPIRSARSTLGSAARCASICVRLTAASIR